MKGTIGILFLISFTALAQRPGDRRGDDRRRDPRNPETRPGSDRDRFPGRDRGPERDPFPGRGPGPGPVMAPGSECLRPGVVFRSDFLGDNGDVVSLPLKRVGDDSIPTSATLAGVIRARTFQSFRDTVCVAENYQNPETVCTQIQPDLALGRGNRQLSDIYNLQLGLMARGDLLSKTIRFGLQMVPADKLDLSMKIVSGLNKIAANSGIPKSWEEFVQDLSQLVGKGIASQYTVDEITLMYGDANKQALGFIPMPGADVREGQGNGRLEKLFDLGLSPDMRAQRIMDTIVGVSPTVARKLTRSLISFAASNGIPHNWTEFVFMMKDSVATGDLPASDLQRITVDLEKENRASMGFEITAQVCRNEVVVRTRNVVRLIDRRVPTGEAVRNFKVVIENAPLLRGEEDVFSLRFDGIRQPLLESVNQFNRYQVTSQVDTDNGVVIQVRGERNNVRPRNTLKVEALKVYDKNSVRLQNLGFNPKMGGKVLVKVRYINGKLFGDKTLGTETYELTDGSMKVFEATTFRNKEVDFVKVSMQILGSPYYSSEFSEEIKDHN